MITHLRFNHKGEQVMGRLVFDLKEIKNMILVIPVTCKEEIGDQILFHRGEDASWVTDAPAIRRYPLTCESLTDKLNHFFRTCGFTFNMNTDGMGADDKMTGTYPNIDPLGFSAKEM